MKCRVCGWSLEEEWTGVTWVCPECFARKPVPKKRPTMRLKGKARSVFVNALLDPPAPGPRLAAAAKRYARKKAAKVIGSSSSSPPRGRRKVIHSSAPVRPDALS